MATLPPIKRFLAEDFPTQTSWIGKLFYPLNLFLNATYSALNNGLTINQNTVGLVANLSSLVANSSGQLTTTIKWPYTQSPPKGVAILSCTQNGGTTAANYPIINWTYNSGIVTINLTFLALANVTISGSPYVVYTPVASNFAVTVWISGG